MSRFNRARTTARELLSDAAYAHRRHVVSRGLACVASVERLSDDDARLILNALHDAGVVVVTADGVERGPALGTHGDFGAHYYAIVERVRTATAAERAEALARVLAVERAAIRPSKRSTKVTDDDAATDSGPAPVESTVVPVAPVAPSYGSALAGTPTVAGHRRSAT